MTILMDYCLHYLHYVKVKFLEEKFSVQKWISNDLKHNQSAQVKDIRIMDTSGAPLQIKIRIKSI